MSNVITSKQFRFSARDIARGILVGAIVAIIPIVTETINTWVAGGDFIINWRLVVDAAWKATIGYLTLNFFTPSKVMAIPDKGTDLVTAEKQVKKVI